MQEFLDLVKNGKTVEAIQYARDNLSASAEANMSLLQQAMATLAFPNPQTAPQFKVSRFDDTLLVLLSLIAEDYKNMFSRVYE